MKLFIGVATEKDNKQMEEKVMTRSEAGRLGAAKSAERARTEKQKRIEQYDSNPKLCRECSAPLSYEDSKRKKSYCNSSCSASYNNKRRAKALEENLVKDCKNPECNEKILQRRIYCSNACQRQYIRSLSVKDGTAGPKSLKRFLLESSGHRCWTCNKQEWMGQPIPLELEHIDGNSENNSLDNLKILCCNCHALTPTYKGANKGNGRHYRRERYQEGKSF